MFCAPRSEAKGRQDEHCLGELGFQRRPLHELPLALRPGLGTPPFSLGRIRLCNLETGQTLDHALRPVDDAPYAGRLGAHVVGVGVHGLNQLLAGVVRAVLVEGVVEIEEEGFEVFDLFGGLVDAQPLLVVAKGCSLMAARLTSEGR